jgi:hypothetical protein
MTNEDSILQPSETVNKPDKTETIKPRRKPEQPTEKTLPLPMPTSDESVKKKRKKITK